MKIGDLVRWTEVEEVYHKFCTHPNVVDLTNDRKCGIIVDRNPKYFFVLWQNKELICQLPDSIEVIK